MSFPAQIQKIAFRLGSDAQSQASQLQQELLEIKARERKIEATLHAANLAHERSASFVPELGGNLQCPRCWVNQEVRAVLTPIGGGTGKEEFFRCDTCNLDVTLHF
jgi:hypothetical protein